MGTRSLTKIQDETGRVFTTLYRQFDGYPKGHGQTILDALGDAILVNGIPFRHPDRPRMVNGMGEAALRLLLFMKLAGQGSVNSQPTIKEQHAMLFEPGSVYIMHPDAHDCGEEWIYTIYMVPAEKPRFGEPVGELRVCIEEVTSDGTNLWYAGPITEELFVNQQELAKRSK